MLLDLDQPAPESVTTSTSPTEARAPLSTSPVTHGKVGNGIYTYPLRVSKANRTVAVIEWVDFRKSLPPLALGKLAVPFEFFHHLVEVKAVTHPYQLKPASSGSGRRPIVLPAGGVVTTTVTTTPYHLHWVGYVLERKLELHAIGGNFRACSMHRS